MKSLEKKGQVMQNLGALGIGVATIVIILAVAFLVMAQTGAQAATFQTGATSLATCNSTACNATKDLTNATATIPGWVPLIILVAIGGLILSLVSAFGKRR